MRKFWVVFLALFLLPAAALAQRLPDPYAIVGVETVSYGLDQEVDGERYDIYQYDFAADREQLKVHVLTYRMKLQNLGFEWALTDQDSTSSTCVYSITGEDGTAYLISALQANAQSVWQLFVPPQMDFELGDNCESSAGESAEKGSIGGSFQNDSFVGDWKPDPSGSAGASGAAQRCEACNGTGDCDACGGDGVAQNPYYPSRHYPCSVCDETGDCPVCDGTGVW